MSVSKNLKLNTGNEMPIIGLGTWQSKPGEVRDAVEHAIKAGYRCIDGAWAYQNESEVGEGVRNAIKSGIVKREDLFITTKLHGYFFDEVEVGLKDSLTKLGLDYVDLYLIHLPIALKRNPADPNAVFPIVDGVPLGRNDTDHVKVWKQMEECQKKGLTRAIGLSNFNESQIQKVYDAAEIKPANLQVECHAHWPQFELHDFCKKLGISFTAYAPIGSPSRWTIEPDDAILMEDPLITKLAEKYKKTPAQICLRWLMQRGIAVIPKSVTPKRIEENFNVWDFEIDKEDFKAMSEIKKKRLFFMKVFGQFSEYPWKSEL